MVQRGVAFLNEVGLNGLETDVSVVNKAKHNDEGWLEFTKALPHIDPLLDSSAHCRMHLLHCLVMEKEVFLLRFFDDLGIREISEVINKSQSTVKTHLYRALKKFKDDASFRDFLREMAV